MKLEGIHHITAITGDAPANVNFYAGTLGLRLVKRSVNQDDPTVYHLFYADEEGSPGADLTFFEYPGSTPGIAGDGMVHQIVWRVAGDEALDFWRRRLDQAGVPTRPVDAGEGRALRFTDPEGLGLELRVAVTPDPPLVARHPDIPEEVAIQGFLGVRAYSRDPGASAGFLGGLGFTGEGGEHSVRGDARGSFYAYDPAPRSGVQGAGTVHHVAWAAPPAEHEGWRERVIAAGGHPTPVIDRFYFRSIYFREPSGVLFEIASIGPGFGVDEDPAHLGERLSLPPAYEPLRARLEQLLTPLPDPRGALRA